MLALIIAVFALLVYILQAYIYKKYWNKNLDLDIHFSSDAVYAGDEVELVEVVTNGKRLPLPVFTVKFETSRNMLAMDNKNSSVSDNFYRNDIFTLRSLRKVTRSITFYCKKRGYYDIHDITLLAPNLFLRDEQVAEYKVDCSLYVYPERINDELGNRILSRVTGDILSKRHRQEDVFEFRGIRDYEPTDEMRTINWKASARTGDLKVNMKNYTSLRAVRIFLNIDDTGVLKHMNSNEYALTLAGSLARGLLESGMRVSLETNGMDLRTCQRVSVLEGGGRLQLDSILKSISRIDLDQQACSFVEKLGDKLRDNNGGIYTVLITSEVRPEHVELVKDMVQNRSEFYIVQVLEKESEDKDLLAGITNNYQKLVITN